MEIAIPFCIEYDNRKCLKCAEGFTLDEKEGKCFSEIENCLKYNGILCSEC